MASLAERVAQPFETFVETVTGSSAGGLDILAWVSKRSQRKYAKDPYPSALSETVETKLVGDLSSVHGILQGS